MKSLPNCLSRKKVKRINKEIAHRFSLDRSEKALMFGLGAQCMVALLQKKESEVALDEISDILDEGYEESLRLIEEALLENAMRQLKESLDDMLGDE